MVKFENTIPKLDYFWFSYVTAYYHHRCVKFRILDALKDEWGWSLVSDS